MSDVMERGADDQDPVVRSKVRCGYLTPGIAGGP